MRPLPERVMTKIGDKSKSAAFVGLAGNHTVREVLKAAIDPQEVIDIQSKIISGKMIPEY
jgi:hypothetical protein